MRSLRSAKLGGPRILGPVRPAWYDRKSEETDPRNSIAEMGISGSMPAMRMYFIALRDHIAAQP
ncbi:MAG TPA: hypothetical protein VHT21_13460 [Stellaceae bacterium]|nr:hypothetical protein [Stellaceae bacterium]